MSYNIICFLFGHAGDANESGWHVCSRCGMHEYWDHGDNPCGHGGEYEINSIAKRPIWFIKHYTLRKFRKFVPPKCVTCGGRYKCKNPEDCIPF